VLKGGSTFGGSASNVGLGLIRPTCQCCIASGSQAPEPNLQLSDCKMSSPIEVLSTISTPSSSSPSAFATTNTPPSSKPPSTDSPFHSAQVTSPALIGTTLPSSKLPLTDPQPPPVPTEEKIINVPKHHFEFSLPSESDQGSRPKKRHCELSLPSDQCSRPPKRVKKLVTTVSAAL
jgi:hypothetical protein